VANPDTLTLVATAEANGLKSVLVGGNAVSLYAYFRTTFDVDLLVREADVERWMKFFQDFGYTIFHRSSNFIRLRFASEPASALPVDLMLSDEETFKRIRGSSRHCELGDGLSLAVPNAPHLIAMKNCTRYANPGA
jgi:hypothetical protein